MIDPDGPSSIRRQYATLEEFERAHGHDPNAVEEWLNGLHGQVLRRDEFEPVWLFPGMRHPEQYESEEL